MNPAFENRKIALALSGGGVRAMMFHMGVLKYLSMNGLLESVNRVSTVSGGSLLLGLIFNECSYHWPSSEEFILNVYPAIRESLCSRSLTWGAVRQLRNPCNWRYLLSRSNLVAKALHKEWGINVCLSDLDFYPEWSINGTTAETGKRFRFKKESLGEYTLGYADPGDYPLANALAISAAFPGGFGPLSIQTKNFDWKKRFEWRSSPESMQSVKLEHKRLHLYDGGVYDNLGLEPFFDAGRSLPKPNVDFIYISDAGAPLAPSFSNGSLNPWRLKRVADIMSDQSHALRVRTFINYLNQDAARGAYTWIGMPAAKEHYLNGNKPSLFPTTLRRVTTKEFDCIAGHGFAVANMFPYCYQ